MKNSLITFFAALFFLFPFVSCKKGKDDPFISFHTRKHRLVNEWKCTNGYAQLIFRENGSEDVFTLNETDHQMALSHPNYYYPAVLTYSLNMNFGKDGQFLATETLAGDVNHVEGTWNFNSGVGDEKNKESITIIVNKSSMGSDESLFFVEGNVLTYKIKELREKKLVLTVDNYVYTDGDDYTKLTGTYTFE